MIQGWERGAVAVTVAISLLLLVGMTALALDGGVAYNERRSTQNAADHAALAAAWAKCNGATDVAAQEAGRNSALLNGYDGNATDIDVTITRVTGTDASYDAAVTSTKTNNFAGVVGQPKTTVLSRAVADCTRNLWGGGFALFADAPPSCVNGNPAELDFSGGGVTIDGQVHSNGEIRIQGNNGDVSTISGLTTWVAGPPNTNGVDFTGGSEQSSPRPDPFNIPFSRYIIGNSTFQPGVDYFGTSGSIDANWLENNGYADRVSGVMVLKRSGVYFAGDEIGNFSVRGGTDITSGLPVTATFVAGDRIHMTGSGNLTHYDPNGVVLFSNYRSPASCANTRAIDWTMSSATWTGLIYAPNGQVSMSLSSGAGVNGAIFGYSIDLSGSDFVIRYEDVTQQGPEFEVVLSE